MSNVWNAPSGNPRPPERVLDEERGLRHVRRVLEQPDVAGHQRRRGEPDDLPEREVPRHHREHRTERLVPHVRARSRRPHPRRPARRRASRPRAARRSDNPSRTSAPRRGPRRSSCPSRSSSRGRSRRSRPRARRPPRSSSRARSSKVVAPVLRRSGRGPGDAFVDLRVGQRLERLLDLAGRRIRRRNRHDDLVPPPGAPIGAAAGRQRCQDGRVSASPTSSPFASSPFVRAIEPITESDDEIRAALAEAEVPPLLPALAYLTGDLSLLRDDLRPDPILLAMPQGGLTEAQHAEARELALDDARPRSATAAAGPRRRPSGRPSCCRSWSSRSAAAPTWRRTSRSSKRSSRSAAKTAARPRWRKAEVAPDADFAVVDHRRGDVGAARRAPPAAGRASPFVDLREERRRRRHLAREHAIPAAGSTTRTTTTATRSRSATTGRCTSRPRTCCSTTSAAAPTRSGSASTSGSAPRSRRPTWSDADRRWTVARARTPTAARKTIDAERGHQRGRPAQPAAVPRHRRAATRSRARPSTPPAGTTTSTCAASASR